MNKLPTVIWRIDPGHSAIQFKVKHLAIAHVAGAFTSFAGTLQTDREDFDGAQVMLRIEVDSLTTNNPERDAHLKSPLFFDTEQYPAVTFSGLLHKKTDGYELAGDLMIHGTTKHVILGTSLTGSGKDRFGSMRVGFELTGTLNRTDFGLRWNGLTEAGGLIVGEQVKLHMDIELIEEHIETLIPENKTCFGSLIPPMAQ